MNIVVDSEFRSLIPPLTDDEYSILESSIVNEGCRDALVTWNGILVDGHNRYEICIKHNIPFETIQKEFDDRNSVIEWIILNQFGRRNLPIHERGRLALRLKPVIAEKAKDKEIERKTTFQKSEKSFMPQINTTKEIAKIAGVSHDTIAKVETIENKAPEVIVNASRKGDISVNSAYQVTKLEPEQQEEIVHRIEHIQHEPKETNTPKAIVQDVIKRPHVTNNSGCNEWYTPEKFVNLARKVLGNIDLDPASCEYANRTIKADKYFTIEDNGLTHEWHGNIWMNPPYTSELVTKFTEKFVDEYKHGNITSGIVLVNNATETSWFTNMVSVAKAVVFPRGRIRYESSTRDSLAPLQGQAFIYFGNDENNFLSVFSEIGWGAIIHNG